MMKFLFAFLFVFFFIGATAQNVGIGIASPNASAQLDITSADKGLLIPRMNSAAITSITNPAKGLMVLDTAKNQLMFNIGTPASPNWQAIAFNSGWSVTGNAGTNAVTNFIGTMDNVPLNFRVNSLRAGTINHIKFNTFLGSEVANLTMTGERNVSIGSLSFQSNTSGEKNSAIGSQSLLDNETGSNNTAIGYDVLRHNIGGSRNNALGVNALGSNTSGNDNTAIGLSGLYNTKTGSFNLAIGQYAGYNNLFGSGNVFIGNRAGYLEEGSNRLYIANTLANANNALIYGEFDNQLLRTNGRMQVNSDNTLIEGLRVIKNYATGTNSNARAIYGENAIDDNYGIGVEGKGGRVGVQGTATGAGVIAGYVGVKGISDGINGAFNFGVQGQASGSSFTNTAIKGEASGSTGDKYGLHGSATGAVGTNYGVYGTASGGATNYAGYFNGNVFTDAKLGVGIPSPGFPIDVKGLGANSDLIKFYDNTAAAKWHLNLANSNLVFVETNVADNRLVLGTGGNVGVGKVPAAGSAFSRFQIKQQNADNGFGIEAASTTDRWDFFVSSGTGNMTLYYNGNPKGTFGSSGGTYTPSDRRLKKDVSFLPFAIHGLMHLQAYQYHYLDNKPNDNFSNGFMAQDVQKVFPDAVIEMEMKDGEKRLGINYQYFTVLAVKGLQEQQKIIDSQEERLKKLEAQVQAMLEKK